MKLTSTLALLCAPLLGLLGCSTTQRFEDVSAAPAYRAYVGATYRLQVAMHLSGVNAPPGYEKTVDYYVVTPTSPGWAGPELITRDTLAVGTDVTVTAVRRCTNCPLDEVVDAEIRVSGYTTAFARPIHIRVKYLAPDFATKQNQPNQAPAPASGRGSP
jgi:hypothetical protein